MVVEGANAGFLGDFGGFRIETWIAKFVVDAVIVGVGIVEANVFLILNRFTILVAIVVWHVDSLFVFDERSVMKSDTCNYTRIISLAQHKRFVKRICVIKRRKLAR